jgi:hypothetical protein
MSEWNHQLLGANRRILAESQHWPPGVLEACVRLDSDHPGWSVWWRHECTLPGLEHPAGFVAQSLRHEDVVVCGGTVEELGAAITGAPDAVEWWMRGKCCSRRWRSRIPRTD